MDKGGAKAEMGYSDHTLGFFSNHVDQITDEHKHVPSQRKLSA